MSENSKTADKAVVTEMRRFIEVIEKHTTLKKPDVIVLAKIYGLGAFFQKYAGRIVEKKLGEKVAEVVLFLLKIRAIRTEFRDGICKTANENPKLRDGLRSWLMDQSIGELGGEADCKRPAPVPTPAPVSVPVPASAPILVYVAGKHDGWAEISRD